MTIKAITETYRNFHTDDFGGENKFKVHTNKYGKFVLVVEKFLGHLSLIEAIRVSDGKACLLGHSRPCGSLLDACDVFDEMIWDNDDIMSAVG